MKKLFLAALAALLVSPAFADCVLRQSTASQTIQLPRFVDSTDGVTPETGLTIANTDIKIGKAGATTQSNKNSGGATHIATGDYYTTFDATDTNTVGSFHVVIAPSGALPVWLDCLVVEEAVYDAFYAANAVGIPSIPANWLTATGIASDAITAAKIANAALDEATFASDTGPRFGILTSGTAQAGSTSTTLVLAASENFTADDRPRGATCAITSGTGAGAALGISSYVNSTDTATMNGTWPTTPDNTSVYLCWRTAPNAAGSGLDAAGVRSALGFASASYDTDKAVTNSKIDAVDDYVDTEVAAIKTKTDFLPSAAAGGNGGVPTVDASNAVKVQSGTGANQISLSSGAVLLQATQTGVTIPTVTTVGTVTNLTNAPTSGDLTATMKASVVTAVQTAQGILTGTCSSGSTTTCVDAARTEADATQLQDRLICFSDGWCAMLTTFNPGTDTATTTKTAPSTRASKTYTIFPSTAQ